MITERQMVKGYLKGKSLNQKIKYHQIQIQRINPRVKDLQTLVIRELEKLVEEDNPRFEHEV